MSLTQTALDVLVRYGYFGIFVFTFLETSLLFPLLPSELVVPALAAVVVGSASGVVGFALVGAAGGSAGGLFAYHVFGAKGSVAAERYGQYVRVSQADIDRSRRLFTRWGRHSVFWGRFFPFFRSAVSIPAGFARMNRARFLCYTAAGTFLFDAAVAAVVLYGGRRVERLGFGHLFARGVSFATEFAASRPVLAGVAVVFILAAVGVAARRSIRAEL